MKIPSRMPLKLPVLAATALVFCPSCAMMATPAPAESRRSIPASERQWVKAPPSRLPPTKGRLPDPRYRPPANFSELETVAGKVAKTTGREIRWRLELGENPGPLAKIRGGLDNCTIYLHPLGARKLSPNTWAFIFGHEFAHRVENLGDHSRTSPSNELKADIAGARYAMAAGYRLEAFLGWMLTEPNQESDSHGSPHRRAYAVAAHFGVPQRVVRAEAQRYSTGRAARQPAGTSELGRP